MMNVALLRVLFTHTMLVRPRWRSADWRSWGRWRPTSLYEFSAASLDQPRLTALLDHGVPAYVWPHADRHIWYIGNTGTHLRAIARATGTRLLWEPSPLTAARR